MGQVMQLEDAAAFFYDVAIIGAGVVGCACARTSSQQEM